MRQVISFDRVKLTNNEMDDKGHVGNTWPALPTPLYITSTANRVNPHLRKTIKAAEKLNEVEEWRTLNVLADLV